MKTYQDAVQEQFNHFRALWNEREEVVHKLNISLALQSLCPDAFDGSARSAYTNLIGDISRPETMEIEVRTSSGKIHFYPLKDVPEIIVAHHLKLRFEKTTNSEERTMIEKIWSYFKDTRKQSCQPAASCAGCG